MKFRPVGDDSFHPDGRMDWQTDLKKLIIAFSNFAKAPPPQKQIMPKSQESASAPTCNTLPWPLAATEPSDVC